jgi:TonB family protein
VFDDEPEATGARRLARRAAPIVAAAFVLVGAAWLLWTMANDHASTLRQIPPTPIVALTPPPPPPPPPPPKNPPPEPEKIQNDVPQPQPTAQPKAAPQNLTINGPPQAGGDAFGLGAGNGQGSVVGGSAGPGGGGDGGFAEAAYTRYMTGFIQEAVQEDDRVTRAVFQIDVQLWVDRVGRITNASVVKSSGDPKLDHQVITVLLSTRLDQPPPSSFHNFFSHRITIRGRRA